MSQTSRRKMLNERLVRNAGNICFAAQSVNYLPPFVIQGLYEAQKERQLALPVTVQAT